MAILEYISQNGNNVRTLDIANALQLEKPTVSNFLKTLQELGYVQQDQLTPRYQLTDKMLLLTPPKTSVVLLKQRFREVLQAITDKTGETSYLTVQMGSYIRHELKCDADRSVRISLELGRELEVLYSAIGNVFMAYSQHLKNAAARNLSPKEMKVLDQRLVQVLKLGYASDFESLEKELNCIAVPVFDQGRLVAAIGVSGPAYRFKESKMKQAAAIIQTYLDAVPS